MIRLAALLALLSSPSFAGDAGETKLNGWVAKFSERTARYGHNVLGDTPEWGRLCLQGKGKRACVTLPETSVFEDIEPRLADMDLDGEPEALVIESDASLGAALAIYDLGPETVTKVATPNIGTSFRWLAPAGIADFDGDGTMDVAYVDRPHLAKTLRVWSYRQGELVEIATAQGLTNHKIGQNFISGGVRTCDDTPEIITADASWDNIVASIVVDGTIQSRVLGPFEGTKSFRNAMLCRI